MNKLIILLLLVLSSTELNSQTSEKDLKKLVLKQIEMDLSAQDTSYFLFDFSAGVEKAKPHGDRYNDTIRFVFQDDSYLRFYFVTNYVAKAKAQLKLLGIDPKIKKIPPVKHRELSNTGTSLQVVAFDYHTKYTEHFLLVLHQSPEEKGISYVAATQYLPKN